MNYTKRLLFGIALYTLLAPSEAMSQVVLFVPGDAYFRSELTEESVKKMESGEDVIWTYRIPDWLEPDVPRFRSNVGVSMLKTQKLPKEVVSTLAALYGNLRITQHKQVQLIPHEGKQPDMVEVNGFPLFICAKTYNANRFGIGKRYNEDWPKITQNAFGKVALTGERYYQPISNDSNLIIDEWRWAHEVGPLPHLPLPDDKWLAQAVPPYQTPLISDGSELQFVVCGSRDVGATISEKPYHPYYIVSSNKTVCIQFISNADHGETGYRKDVIDWVPAPK